jgi:serine/threonine-protein kinase
LTDIFGVESEIAKRIAEALQAELSEREEQALAVKPTNNPKAYDAYLRGLAFTARSTIAVSSYSATDLQGKAAAFYEQAVQVDPDFAIAWARLSRAHAIIYFLRGDTTAARRDAAKRALENAQKLQPTSPETLLALGDYQYRVLRDYGLAKSTFRQVSKMLPSSSEAPLALGRVSRREGNWNESIAYYEQTLTLDPRNLESLIDAAQTYIALQQFAAALKLFDRALDITPNDPVVRAQKAGIYQGEGNLEEAARFLSEIDWQTADQDLFTAKVAQLRFERNYREAVRLLQTRQAQFHFASQYDKSRNQVWLAFSQRLAGDVAGAKVTAEQARHTLEQLYKDQPDNASLAVSLSLAYAEVSEKESALEEAKRAVALLPRAKDSVDGPCFEENLSLIQTILGENGRAISTLTQLLQTPHGSLLYLSPITPAVLRLDPLWDPLRGDPAFQKLCEEKQLPATP